MKGAALKPALFMLRVNQIGNWNLSKGADNIFLFLQDLREIKPPDIFPILLFQWLPFCNFVAFLHPPSISVTEKSLVKDSRDHFAGAVFVVYTHSQAVDFCVNREREDRSPIKWRVPKQKHQETQSRMWLPEEVVGSGCPVGSESPFGIHRFFKWMVMTAHHCGCKRHPTVPLKMTERVNVFNYTSIKKKKKTSRFSTPSFRHDQFIQKIQIPIRQSISG